MIIKFRIDTKCIVSWGYEEADKVYVHKKFANEVRGEYSFYPTPKVTSLEAHENGKYPIVCHIVLIDDDKEAVRSIIIPVPGSEIYLLTNDGKTIERIN